MDPTPVLAAGGIGNADDLRRAQRAGAAGAAVGTRLYASHEALDSTAAKQRLVERTGADTTRTTVFDLVPGTPVAGRLQRACRLECHRRTVARA